MLIPILILVCCFAWKLHSHNDNVSWKDWFCGGCCSAFCSICGQPKNKNYSHGHVVPPGNQQKTCCSCFSKKSRPEPGPMLAVQNPPFVPVNRPNIPINPVFNNPYPGQPQMFYPQMQPQRNTIAHEKKRSCKQLCCPWLNRPENPPVNPPPHVPSAALPNVPIPHVPPAIQTFGPPLPPTAPYVANPHQIFHHPGIPTYP